MGRPICGDPAGKGEKMTNELKPCPFCGAGTTEVQEHAIWQGAKYAEPISVSVVHWCEPVEGQPSRMIQKVGRDRASAIAAWNRRSPASGAAAMREAAARVAEGGRFLHDDSPAARWGKECAAAIRARPAPEEPPALDDADFDSLRLAPKAIKRLHWLEAENAKLRWMLAEALVTLEGIARANAVDWQLYGSITNIGDFPAEFRKWAQGRARHAIAKAKEAKP